jgi:eukaryotic-like serine/threonine-protein kinase
MSLKNFLVSKIFIKHLGIAATIIVGLIMILLIWLNFYTRHGQARSVPDFYGLNMEQVTKLARRSKLNVEVIDSVYTTLVQRGCVAEQNPKPGFKVKKWRHVVLILNAKNPEMVAMPNLVDLPIRQAIAIIANSGLEMGQLRYKPDLSVDVVLEQLYNGRSVAEGDSIQKGSIVDLVLGKGLSNQRTEVPDLIGLGLESARKRLLISSLNLGTFTYDKSIKTLKDSSGAFVYKQNPEFRDAASLQLGSAVYLWLTVDSAKLPVNASQAADSTAIPDTEQTGTKTN